MDRIRSEYAYIFIAIGGGGESPSACLAMQLLPCHHRHRHHHKPGCRSSVVVDGEHVARDGVAVAVFWRAFATCEVESCVAIPCRRRRHRVCGLSVCDDDDDDEKKEE